MPRARRSNLLGLVAFIALIYFLYASTSSHFTAKRSDFRKYTENGMARKDYMSKIGQEYMSDADLTSKTNEELEAILRGTRKGQGRDEETKLQQVTGSDGASINDKGRTDTPVSSAGQNKLQAAVVESIGSPETEKIPDYEEVPIAGRKMMQKPKPDFSVLPTTEKPRYPASNLALGEGEEEALNGGKIEKVIDLGKDAAREELQRILKKSPVIIFSKSRCPHSRRAKHLLLELYNITPSPHVVELDLLTDPVPGSSSSPSGQTLGRKLQDLLGELTGRTTVPNIMINAQSLGGADEVTTMEKEGRLVEEFRKAGGKRIVEMKRIEGVD